MGESFIIIIIIIIFERLFLSISLLFIGQRVEFLSNVG